MEYKVSELADKAGRGRGHRLRRDRKGPRRAFKDGRVLRVRRRGDSHRHLPGRKDLHRRERGGERA